MPRLEKTAVAGVERHVDLLAVAQRVAGAAEEAVEPVVELHHVAQELHGLAGIGEAGEETIDEGIARPRYPSLKGIMAAKKKPLETKPAQLGQVRVSVKAMELPPERPPGRIIGQGAAAVPELVRLLQEEAKVL